MDTAGKPGSKWEEPAHGGSWAQVLGGKHPEWGKSCYREHSVHVREATVMGVMVLGPMEADLEGSAPFPHSGVARKGPQGLKLEENSQGKPGQGSEPGDSQSTSQGLLGQAGIFSHAIPFCFSTPSKPPKNHEETKPGVAVTQQEGVCGSMAAPRPTGGFQVRFQTSGSRRLPVGRVWGWLHTEYFIREHQSLLIPSPLTKAHCPRPRIWNELLKRDPLNHVQGADPSLRSPIQ